VLQTRKFAGVRNIAIQEDIVLEVYGFLGDTSPFSSVKERMQPHGKATPIEKSHLQDYSLGILRQ